MDSMNQNPPTHLPQKNMKSLPVLLTILLLGSPSALAQTLEWGSQVFSSIVDSNGLPLDETYVFEIGTFEPGFSPAESNVELWYDNWFAFDRAGYSEANGYFTSTVNMLDDGRSDSPFMSGNSPSFEGLEAYLWVRNAETPSPTTEWFLVRSMDWIFPDAIPGCCDNDLTIQWSMSDLTGADLPKWGGQLGTDGPGIFTVSGIYDLQTFTFIPEPSAFLLSIIGMGFLLIRRDRGQN